MSLPPISQDPNPIRRRQRLRVVKRELALHTQKRACVTCGEFAYLSGGRGCTCPVVTAEMLAERLHRIAAGECFCNWWVDGVTA